MVGGGGGGGGQRHFQASKELGDHIWIKKLQSNDSCDFLYNTSLKRLVVVGLKSTPTI